MIRDSALVTDDNKLLTDLDVSVFCPDTVKSYRNIFKLIRQNHLWNKEDDAMFLRRIGAVREDKNTGKFHPTVAGLLMFGYEYEITAVFPNYFLDYQENRTNGIYARWTDRITSQSGDWSGNVFDFILRVIPKLQADLKVPFMFRGNFRDEDTPLHKTVREATVNMLANADFYGRRGVVVQKSAEGFKFANPGSMRVSLTEALQDSASDPRNGVMMKMLAMVEYGERAGSGLQGIFKTWQSVYHCEPKLEVTTSGGVDRTTLTLGFEGHQPDIEAMKLLYGNPDDLIDVSDTLENKGEKRDVLQSVPQTNVNIPQNGINVLQNVPQNNPRVPQKGENLFQDESFDIKQEIAILINEDLQITREQIAKKLNISSKTVGRYLSKLGISWEGHPKTGHWVLPKKN